MIGPTGAVKVMVATKPVDFRKGAEGLAALVRETMGADPFSGAVYVFRAVNAARIFPKSAEVKFPSFAAQTVAEGCPFFGGRPRGRDGGFNVGGVMEAFDRKCSGMSSACWRSR